MFLRYNRVENHPLRVVNAFEVVDSDFRKVIFAYLGSQIGEEIIKVYQNKNLDIAKNFILYIKYSARLCKQSITNELSYHRKNNKLFNLIEKDLEKYLLLM